MTATARRPAGTRRPGRPRSSDADRVIIDATLAEYAEHGFGGMSVDAVAARAGVSKATIYRRYPSKIELVMAAVDAVASERAPVADSGSLRADLLAHLTNLRAILRDPVLGRTVRMIVADAARYEEIARVHAEFVRRRRRTTVHAIEQAVRRGDLDPATDPELAADLLSGPVFYRYLVSRMPVADAYLASVVDAFLAAHGPTHALRRAVRSRR